MFVEKVQYIQSNHTKHMRRKSGMEMEVEWKWQKVRWKWMALNSHHSGRPGGRGSHPYQRLSADPPTPTPHPGGPSRGSAIPSEGDARGRYHPAAEQPMGIAHCTGPEEEWDVVILCGLPQA